MTENTDRSDLYNFVLNLEANAPIRGLVTRNFLEGEVFVIVGPNHRPPRIQLARHGFFHPEIKDLQRPAMLAFTDRELAQSYAEQSPQISSSPISIKDLFSMTAQMSGNSCGVMFRIDGKDYYANPGVVADVNHFAQFIDMQVILFEDQAGIVRDGEFVLTLEQLQDLDDVLKSSPIVESYSLWRGEVEGVETTVIDVVVPAGLKMEDVIEQHRLLTEECTKIVSNATLLARPNARYFDPPVLER